MYSNGDFPPLLLWMFDCWKQFEIPDIWLQLNSFHFGDGFDLALVRLDKNNFVQQNCVKPFLKSPLWTFIHS